MSINSSISVSAPYTLFSIPQPTAATPKTKPSATGRHILTSEITTPIQGKKRKREPSEICAAVGGEGVNLYNVSGTQIVSSYPLPPDTAFTCAPLSVRFAAKEEGKFIRQTYAAVSTPKRRIVGWTETPRVEADGSAPGLELTSHSRELSKGPPVKLLARIGHKRKAPEKGYLIALNNDCGLAAYSPDLAEELWTFSLRGSADGTTANRVVKFAIVCKASTVQQSILAERPDVVLYQPGEEDSKRKGEGMVLFVVTHGGLGGWELHLVLLPNQETVGTKPRALLTLPLGQAASLAPEKTQIGVHLESGSLHMFSNGRIIRFNLLSTMPKLVSKVEVPYLCTSDGESDKLHFLQLSPSVVLVASTAGISLLDTKYSSVQARTVYDKQPQIDIPEASSFHPATWLKSSSVVVGSSKSGLAAVQLSKSGKSTIFSKESSLIDSIGRGLENSARLNIVQPQVKEFAELTDFPQIREKYLESKMFMTRQKLDVKPMQLDRFRKTDSLYYAMGIKQLKAARSNGNLEEFERLFSSFLGIKMKSADRPKKFNRLSTSEQILSEMDIRIRKAEVEGVPRELISKLRSLNMSPYPKIPYEFALETLKTMISPSGPDGKFQITFFPSNTFKTLVLTRCVTTSTLRAIKLSYGGTELAFGEFVDCLVEHDPSLRLLGWVLQRMPEVEPSDIVRAIANVLQRIFSQQQQPAPETEDEDAMVVDDEVSPELQLIRETEKAEKALETASAALAESAMREYVLRVSLARLNTFPHEVIVKNLKQGLDGDELLTLVRMLRKELILDRDDVDDDPDDFNFILPKLHRSSPDNASLICDLLTCCLDAVGLTGLILANEPTRRQSFIDESGTDNSGLLVESLLNEVQKSVSALENSVELGLFLSELTRHASAIAVGAAKERSKKQAFSHHKKKPAYNNEKTKALESKGKAKEITQGATEGTEPAAEPETAVPAPEPATSAPTAPSKPTASFLKDKQTAKHRRKPLNERLALANRGKIPAAAAIAAKKKSSKQRGAPMAAPKEVTAIRKMVAEMLPMFGAKSKEFVTKVGVQQLAMGVVGGRTKYAVEKVEV